MNKGLYSKKVIEYFRNPKNYGTIKGASAKGIAGNIVCGDLMSLYIQVKKNKAGEEYVADIKFQTFGCAAAIATSSAVTDLAKGKTISQALDLDKNDIVEFLEGLPPIKIHCSLLAIDALREAIYQHLKKTKQAIPSQLLDIHKRVESDKTHIRTHHTHWQ
jgi:nitrogen fixation NifU-like protein